MDRLHDKVLCNPTVKLSKGQMYPSIGIDKITPGYKYISNTVCENYSGQSCSKFRKGDTIMARITPCLENGKIAQYNLDSELAMGSTEFFVFRGIKDVSDNDYIYYLISTDYVRNSAVNSMTGASGRQRADIKFIGKLKWDFPEYDVQCKIGKILSNYDELIEKNNRKIEILQEMAEELYKEWFVRFRFPGYKTAKFTDGIPDGWEKVRLKNIVHEVGKSVNPKDRNDYKYYVPIDCISSHSMVLREVDCIENAESSLTAYKKGDILFGAMRPYFHKVVRAPFDGLTRKTCFVLNSYDSITHYYAYMLLFQKETISYATTISVGSTMPYVRWEDFERMNCILPKKEILLKFNNLMETYCNNLELLQCEIDLLKQQRDLLLPRLMSGKLEVKGDAHA